MELRPYQQEIVDRVRDALKHRKKSVLVVLPCGGGKSVIIGAIAKMTTDKHNKILFLVHRAELCDQIRNTFEKMGVDRSKSNICMVQIAEHLTDSNYIGFKPDIIITDEAHHSMANNYTKVYNAYPNAIRIGFTATPTRLDNLNLSQIYEEIIESVSVQWLIDNKYLAPFRYYSADFIDLEDIHKNTIYSDIIENYNKFAKNKQAICYCPNVQTSKMVADLFKTSGIFAEYLDGSTKKSMRDSVISDFKNGKLKIICNVDLISEGFDVPDCEAVILLRKTQSLTLFVQQSMRSMRYKPNKIAIIIDHVGNYLKFGLPTQLRNWEYFNENKDGKESKKSAQNDEKECPNCYSVFPKDNDTVKITEIGFKYTCPFCYHVWEEKFKGRKDLNFENCNLNEITGFTLKIDKSYKDCQNIFELYNHAVDKQYKKSWVVHKSKELGFLKSLEDYRTLAKILGYKNGWAYFQYKLNFGGDLS